MILTLLFSAGLLALAPAPAGANATVPAKAPAFEELRERGRQAYAAKRFEEARALWADAFALEPDSAETAADLALAYQHLDQKGQAIQANRDAIRLSAAGKDSPDKARRIRRAAYYNLGKLGESRKIEFSLHNDGPSSCIRIDSETGCERPVFVCGRESTTGGASSTFTYLTGRFALTRKAARVVEQGEIVGGFESSTNVGEDSGATRDRSGAPFYDVTLSMEVESRKPMPGEADVTYSRDNAGCEVVHVDACARRLGLYCAWSGWREGVTDKGHGKAVELTFSRNALPASP